jgi:hypothetical protein
VSRDRPANHDDSRPEKIAWHKSLCAKRLSLSVRRQQIWCDGWAAV